MSSPQGLYLSDLVINEVEEKKYSETFEKDSPPVFFYWIVEHPAWTRQKKLKTRIDYVIDCYSSERNIIVTGLNIWAGD